MGMVLQAALLGEAKVRPPVSRPLRCHLLLRILAQRALWDQGTNHKRRCSHCPTSFILLVSDYTTIAKNSPSVSSHLSLPYLADVDAEQML
jgi:hypothetical protein